MGDTVLSGTGGEGDTAIIDPPQPMSPAKIHAPAAATIASDTPMHSRLPTRGLCAFIVLKSPWLIPPGVATRIRAMLRLDFMYLCDFSHSITIPLHFFGVFSKVFGFRILVTFGAGRTHSVSPSYQWFAAARISFNGQRDRRIKRPGLGPCLFTTPHQIGRAS